jgi:hypothetical protein
MKQILMAQANGDEFEPWNGQMLGLFECWDIDKPNKTIFFKGVISTDLYLDWLNESKKYKKPVFITETWDSFKAMKKISKVTDSIFVTKIDEFWIFDEETEQTSEVISEYKHE